MQNDTVSNGNNGGFDWASGPGGPGVFDANGNQTLVNPQLLRADFVADYPQPDTSYFATSAKDIDDVSSWNCGSVNNPTAKDEILNAYATLWQPSSGADAGHVILDAAAERLSNNGNAFMGFWLFQGRVGCNSPTGAATPFVGAHNVGDVLILSNFTGGGANPLVQVYVWNPGTPQQSNPLELKFSGNFCSASSNDPTIDQACGAVNTTSFQTPWLPSNTALTALEPNEFLEVGVDLTQLLANANATIPCFARFQAETRTSQSTTSQLKDFASGSFNTCTATTVTHPKDAHRTTLNDSTPVPSSTVIHDEATVTGTALVGTAPNPEGTVAFCYCRPTDQTAGGSTACRGGSTSAGTVTLTRRKQPGDGVLEHRHGVDRRAVLLHSHIFGYRYSSGLSRSGERQLDDGVLRHRAPAPHDHEDGGSAVDGERGRLDRVHGQPGQRWAEHSEWRGDQRSAAWRQRYANPDAGALVDRVAERCLACLRADGC